MFSSLLLTCLLPIRIKLQVVSFIHLNLLLIFCYFTKMNAYTHYPVAHSCILCSLMCLFIILLLLIFFVYAEAAKGAEDENDMDNFLSDDEDEEGDEFDKEMGVDDEDEADSLKLEKLASRVGFT